MSEVGVLSYEFEQASELAAKLDAVLHQGAGSVAGLQERTELALALNSLVDLLDPLREGAAPPRSAMRVPVGLVRRLRGMQVRDEPMSKALHGVALSLSDRNRKLSADQLRLLGEVAAANEREVSAVFRRMVRR